MAVRAGVIEAMSIELTPLERKLVRVGIELHAQRNPEVILEHVLTEARKLACAEAGTILVKDGETLRFAVVQNEVLARRVGGAGIRRALQTATLPVSEESLAGWVAMTGETVNIPDVDEIPARTPYAHNRTVDFSSNYRTRSVLTTPIRDHANQVLGVLQLINAVNGLRRIVPFDRDDEYAATWFAAQAARAVRQLRQQSGRLPVPGASTPLPA